MPIEIRELVIKATVHERIHSPQKEREEKRKRDKLKRELLDACKDYIQEMLEDQQNR